MGERGRGGHQQLVTGLLDLTSLLPMTLRASKKPIIFSSLENFKHLGLFSSLDVSNGGVWRVNELIFNLVARGEVITSPGGRTTGTRGTG